MNSITRIAVLKAGGPTKVAGKLELTKQAVVKWDKCPAKHVLALEAMSGVSRYLLRPDVYGPEPHGPLVSSGEVVAA